MNSLYAAVEVPRLDELTSYILGDKILGLKGKFFVRSWENGGRDVCIWQGEQDIIHDPEAVSPKILWVYMDPTPGTTRAYKLYDLPDGSQAEDYVKVSCDEDIDALLEWVTQ
jgi:hypothetical protein